MDGFHSATLIENLFDKNCYNNSIPGYTRANSTFNHGLYVNGDFNNDAANYYTNGPVTMSGNIYMRDATTPHLRSGGFLNNNLWAYSNLRFWKAECQFDLFNYQRCLS